MDFDFDTGTIYQGLATLDVTALPPLGSGPANVLTIIANGALTLPKGTPAQRPAAAGGTDVAGMFRYNTSVNQLEYYDSTTWQQLTSSAGSVSSFQTSLSGLTPQTATTGAVTLAGTLGATSGGTGTSTAPTAGQFLYSSAGTTYAATTLSGIAVTTFSGDTTGLTPATATSGAITLGGTLVLANGGTGASLTAVQGAPVYGTASAMAFGTAGTSGQAYISGGTGAPTWQDVSSTLTTGQILEADGSGAFTANGATFVGSGSFSGVTLSGTVTNATDAVTKQYVDNISNGLSWKQAVKAATVTAGVLATSYENGDIIDGYTLITGDRILIKSFGTGIATLGSLVAGSGYDTDNVYPGVSLTGGTGSGAVATITVSGGVVTSVVLTTPGTGYVQGDVLSADDADIGGRTGGSAFSITATSLANFQNGIYTVNASGAPTRSTDMDSTTPLNEVNGAAVFIENGSTLADTAWVQTANVTTIGTDSIVWAQFGGPGSYTAGNGLQLLGNQFSLVSPVSIANGGTALSTAPTNGQLLIGNGTGYTLAGLTAGTAIGITPGAGTITINNTGVTSLAGTANQITASASTGAVTLSIPSAFIAPGSVQVTTSLTVDTLTPNSALYVGAAGLVSSTAALTDGQILIGDTGSVPVAGTITGGTGITVTNGAGTITIDVDSAEVVTTFSAGTTGFTPNSATSGAITLAGTLAVTNGGTGLTALGTANQVFGVNAAGSAAEYKTLTAGTGMSIVHGANVVTFNNTGVTSVALALPSIFSVSGSPVTTTGTLTGTLTTQVANTVFAGPATGVDAVPTFRALAYADLPLELYVENPSTPTAPVASGANAVAIGSGSTATAAGSFAEGAGTDARIFGQKAYANGSFATAGDAQHGVYVARNITTNNTLTELFLDGSATQLVLPDNSVFTFDILVAARRTDATGGGAAYRFVGAARKDATAGSVTFIGTPSKTVVGETNGAWDSAVSVDTGTGAFRVRVTGENAKTIRWVATIQTTEVTN